MSEGEFREGSPGVNYDATTGKLYIFTADSVNVIKGWPSPAAYRKTKAHPTWKRIRPQMLITANGKLYIDCKPWQRDTYIGPPRRRAFTLVTGYQVEMFPDPYLAMLYRREEAYMQFVDRIPPRVRSLLSGFTYRQFHMLNFLARCGEPALEMSEANPALAFCLASNWAFHKPAVQRPLRSARALLAKKQVEILEWLGFPATEPTRKLMRKVEMKEVDTTTLFFLRGALRRPELVERLCHLPRINDDIVRIVTGRELRPLVTQGFLYQLSAQTQTDGHYAGLVMDAEHLCRYCRPDTPPPVFHNLSRLESFVEEMRELRHRTMWERPMPRELPPPPLPGTETIIPLVSPNDLVREGREQRNCSASMARTIADGDFYMYSVRMPSGERATMSIAKRHDGSYMIVQLAGPRNQEVSSMLRKHVRMWIDESGKSEP